MKIYKVIRNSIYLESGDISVHVEVFKDEKLAKEFLQREIKNAKQDVENDSLKDYTIDESDVYYERYLTGYATQDSILIYLEEDEFYEEKNIEKEHEYEH